MKLLNKIRKCENEIYLASKLKPETEYAKKVVQDHILKNKIQLTELKAQYEATWDKTSEISPQEGQPSSQGV